MLKSLNKKYLFNDNLKINFRSILSVSLGIFLFLLFFQPFTLRNPDFNNRLIILATFGAITLVLLSIFRLVIPSIFTRAFSEERWTVGKEIIIDLVFVIFNSVAFSFFARFVGKIPITFHTEIIIVIISIATVAVLLVTNQLYMLRRLVEKLKSGEETEEHDDTEATVPSEIEFESENKSENFHLFTEQLILIKSASNYVEIIYKQNEKVHKKLIRNTMRNAEKLMAAHPQMIRCHRTCIVNKNYIQRIDRGSDGLILHLFDYPQEIPVSRQYILTVKEAL
ncbi:MAG TPA: LytTR family transcriptional regulator DNA-binding domain-containing protein, partial [Draconibacterium sp.]|nr:LytTR family transcriptional regulator DNA-binding domain-containing protein [Draconibacterium sp.]